MIKYRKFQFGWVIAVIYIIIIVWMTLAFIYQWGNNPLDKYGYIFFMILFGGILSAFYGITVIVTDKHLLIRFGIGFYTKKIDLSKIKSVTVLKYPVYYGYGIRFVPSGVLYNVSGRYAVEIRLKDKKQVIQIGSDDTDNLKLAIETGIAQTDRPE